MQNDLWNSAAALWIILHSTHICCNYVVPFWTLISQEGKDESTIRSSSHRVFNCSRWNCWWLNFCKNWDVSSRVSNRVSYWYTQLVQDFSHQQYRVFEILVGMCSTQCEYVCDGVIPLWRDIDQDQTLWNWLKKCCLSFCNNRHLSVSSIKAGILQTALRPV